MQGAKNKKVIIGAIAVIAVIVIVGLLTGWFGLSKKPEADKPAATTQEATATNAPEAAPTEPEKAPGTEETAAPTEPETVPAAGKVIITAIADDPEEMDPTRNSYSRSSRVLQNLFVGLYKLDADGTTYVPAMADHYDVSEDGLVYTFTLKEGLKWSDGSPLTARDFEFSWIRALAPDSRCASDLWIIKNGKAYNNSECKAEEVGVKALDDLTFQVTLENNTPWLISLTATTSFFPVKKDLVENNDNWKASVDTYVSNGPFMLVEFRHSNKLILKKNPNYYSADTVKIDEVDFVVIANSSAELIAYGNGEINVSTNLDAEALKRYAGTEEFHTSGRVGIQYCDFNCNLPEFSDKRVRQAFAMAINRQSLLTMLGIVEPAVYGFVPYAQPSLTDSSKSYREVAGDMFKEDVAEAKRLLAEAGYPDGAGFPEVVIVTKNDEQQLRMAQILSQMWKDNLGISCKIDPRESSSYWGDLARGDFSVDRNGYTVDYADASANLKIWVTGSNASENQWDDPVYDELFNKTLAMTDPAEREAALIEAEKYLADQMPGMPMYSYDNQYLVKPNVTGVTCNPIGHIFYEYADIK
ncbi:MAG: peptide ABC transporter substrate-binding protein [Clostridia bacterium]|nr:peptide ABC transporter substrate-binding protein [Clostridia bacterium]